MHSNRVRIAVAAAVIVSATAFHYLTLRPVRIWRDDSCLYILHARNIAEGAPYGDTGFIYNPLVPEYSPRTYPPGLPLLLAPVIRWAGLNLEAMRLETLLFLPAALVVLLLLFLNEIRFPHAMALIALVGFSPWISELLDSVWSEIPFLFFLYLAFLGTRIANEASPGRRSLSWILLAGFAACLAYATRTLGILLVPALWLSDLWVRRRPTRCTVAVTLMCAVWVVAQVLLYGRDSSYFDAFKSWSPRVILNNGAYVRELAAFWENGYANPGPRLLGVAFGALAAWGYLARVRTRVTALEIFLPLYVAVLVIWPPAPIWRYVLPVAPLVLFYSFVALERIGALGRLRTERAVFAALLAATFLSFAVRYSTLSAGGAAEVLRGPTVAEFLAFMRDRTRKDDVFIFIKPRALALFTGRQAALCHEPRDEADLWRFFDEIGATHVILGLRQDKPLALLVERNGDRFETAFSNADFRVCRIRETTPPPGR